jgi:hypothetical protein
MSRAFILRQQQGALLCEGMLRKVGILGNSGETLIDAIGRTCSREHLMNMTLYQEIAREFIPGLKMVYSAAGMNCLRPNAESTQKTPLINLLRQVLRANGYTLIPRSELNGYERNGRKRIYRWFEISNDGGGIDNLLEDVRELEREDIPEAIPEPEPKIEEVEKLKLPVSQLNFRILDVPPPIISEQYPLKKVVKSLDD